VDEFLFGQNFAETFKVAQTCEKTGREVSKSVPQVGKKTLQPIQQAAQQRNQLLPTKPFFRETGDLLFGHRRLAIQERRTAGAAPVTLSLGHGHDATIEQRKIG